MGTVLSYAKSPLWHEDLMSFVISVRGTRRNEAPPLITNQIVSINVITAFMASLLDPASFINTTHREAMGASETPPFALAEATATEKRNGCGLRC